ncbi:hypothetical protein PN36_26560 [Candidatus Thiomargarita nelsonii]|uniref:Uncharacterized protein n=1 Tax=Candidatus Thiomargarita nelsonii TaxID=1003181 RepID=A0A4E0QLW3_9GAMM|nr:hypothetical protein PN36_26560 [Candidatus Thiomargarita nelsonii]
MATLTIELPEILAHQIQTYGISKQSLEQMFVRLVQTYLHKYKLANENPTADVALDGETFARHMISNNRTLFEELSRLSPPLWLKVYTLEIRFFSGASRTFGEGTFLAF